MMEQTRFPPLHPWSREEEGDLPVGAGLLPAVAGQRGLVLAVGSFPSRLARVLLAEELRPHWRLARRLACLRTWQGAAEREVSAEPPAVLLLSSGDVQSATGASFQLPLALIAASERTGLPLPPAWAATGRLAEDGAVGAVDGLQAKADGLRDQAPRVEKLLVPVGSPRVEGLAVHPVATLDEALEAVWPDHRREVERRWTLEQAEELVQHLLRRSVFAGRREVALGAVEEMADALARRLPGDPWAPLVKAVAARHVGRPGPFPAADLEALPRLLRVRLLAEHAQACADALLPESEEVLTRGRALVLPEGSREDLRLLGALGRLAAALGRIALAESLLTECFEGWAALGEYFQGSFSVCELLRLAGARGASSERWERAAERVLRDSATDPVSRAFLQVALARLAWHQGRPWTLELQADLDARLQLTQRRWQQAHGHSALPEVQAYVDRPELADLVALIRAHAEPAQAARHLRAVDRLDREWRRYRSWSGDESAEGFLRWARY